MLDAISKDDYVNELCGLADLQRRTAAIDIDWVEEDEEEGEEEVTLV